MKCQTDILATRPSNNAINADSKKRRSHDASLFAAGYGERWASQ